MQQTTSRRRHRATEEGQTKVRLVLTEMGKKLAIAGVIEAIEIEMDGKIYTIPIDEVEKC